MRTSILMIILIGFFSCSSDKIDYQTENKLIITKDNLGVLMWTGKGKPISIFNDCFRGKRFIENPITRNDTTIYVSIIDNFINKVDSVSFNWSDYNIDFQSKKCNWSKSSNYLISRVFGFKDSVIYYTKEIVQNDTILRHINTLPNFKFISVDKGYRVDPSFVLNRHITRTDKSLNGDIVYLLHQEIHYKNQNIDTVIYKYNGYFDYASGNGIFNLDISDDGKTILIPILKTSFLQWITFTGKGSVIFYDVPNHRIIKTLNKRMHNVKLSPDNRLIAYSNNSKDIMIYEISSEKSYKIAEGESFEWIK